MAAALAVAGGAQGQGRPLAGVSREWPVKRRPWGRKDPANGALAAKRGKLRVCLALSLAGNDEAGSPVSFPFVAPPAAGLDDSPFAATFCFKAAPTLQTHIATTLYLCAEAPSACGVQLHTERESACFLPVCAVSSAYARRVSVRFSLISPPSYASILVQLDDCTLQLYKINATDNDYGSYLDLESTIDEQGDDFEGFQDNPSKPACTLFSYRWVAGRHWGSNPAPPVAEADAYVQCHSYGPTNEPTCGGTRLTTRGLVPLASCGWRVENLCDVRAM
ncbi:hypothetical protein HPB51_016756 [Rhipicephalus microplus]|uniref:FHOD1 N-terminal GTPase-binding domain-containing protein n=1 Tax=Rhipicephalus microplus TaxID=6941 RepID=A0A9J6DBB6_RHIMP|nr:hypothetical protein HPB51_016756 [Rhipicephalus microplus]